MAKFKKYLTDNANVSMFFHNGVGSEMITFRACATGGYFVTNNKGLQDGIENDPAFGVVVFGDPSNEPDEVKEPIAETPRPETPVTGEDALAAGETPSSETPATDEEVKEETPVTDEEAPVTDEAVEAEVLQDDEAIAPNVFPDVTNAQQAKDVLRGEPYKVEHQKLRGPEQIRKVAESLGVQFPNWND